jgi:hypothetical protein
MDSVTEILSKIPAIWTAFSSMGKAGVIIAAALTGLMGVLSILMLWNRNKIAQAKTDKKRAESEANNPVQNSEDGQDMRQGEDDIEKIINSEDN